VAWIVLWTGLGIFGHLPFLGWASLLLWPLIGLADFVIWLILVFKAYQLIDALAIEPRCQSSQFQSGSVCDGDRGVLTEAGNG
jgi:hypothetical protein